MMVKSSLKNEPYELIHATIGQEALDYIHEKPPDAVLLDLNLPDMTGFEILEYLRNHQIKLAVIVVTAHTSVKNAVEAMRLGAQDFIEKPFQPERLIITLRNVLEQTQLRRLKEFYERSLDRQEYHDFIGGSTAMQTIYRIIDNVATSKAPVFITGESGTGKELCALALHKQSQRKNKPFVAINCAAIPKELFESELFGHVKGAFTGAVAEREGAASRADSGTLFLDEIGDMDQEAQTKLLRFIQTGVVQKVGGNREVKVDVRFICATNHDVHADIQHGRFREDLFYRLNVVPIKLPALRKRNGDIMRIARRFLERFSRDENKYFLGFAPKTEEVLVNYSWPGNVRQLQNVIHNVVVLHDGEYVTPDMLPDPLNQLDNQDHTPQGNSVWDNHHSLVREQPHQPSNRHSTIPSILPLWQLEKNAILQAIEICSGDVAKAAVMLEINASTIYRKLRAWKKFPHGFTTYEA